MNHKVYLVMAGLKIKIARLEKGLTKTDVCRLTGLEFKAVASIEIGRKDNHILTYKRVADSFGVVMKDFM